MKTSFMKAGVMLVSVALSLAGCAKNEPATSTPEAAKAAATKAAPAPETTAATATAPAKAQLEAAGESLAATVADAKAKLADIKVPDLKTASESKLASVSAETLTNLAALAGPSQPAVSKQVEAVKASLSAENATDALGQLKQLAAAVESIPGAPAAIEASKQMVSAWALKQGFDTAAIEPVLGALQTGDIAGLASQAATLLGAGGLTDQQKGLVNKVLETYGVEAKAGEVVGKVKGLLGR